MHYEFNLNGENVTPETDATRFAHFTREDVSVLELLELQKHSIVQ